MNTVVSRHNNDGLFQHPVYQSYFACAEDGSVYNKHGIEMTVNKYKSLRLRVGSITVSILHRLFVWQCLYGIVPKGYNVYFDKYVDGRFCDKLVLYKNKQHFDENTRNKLRDRMLIAGYYTHPRYKNYMANKNGHVFSLFTEKMLSKKPNGEGYIQLCMFENNNRKTKYCHVIVWEAVTGRLVSPGYQIDHVDRDNSNNSFTNLKCLTIKEHTRKTHDENPYTTRQCREVARIGIGEDDSLIKFPSRKAAAEGVQGIASSVSIAISNMCPYKGYMWYDCSTTEHAANLDADEEWKGLYNKEGKLAISASNLGRIQGPNKIKPGDPASMTSMCLLTNGVFMGSMNSYVWLFTVLNPV